MFTVKYRPTKLDDFIGNKKIIQPFINWLLNWDPKNKKIRCALVSGLNGVGKSLLVELILNTNDFRKFRTLWYKNISPDFCNKCHFIDIKPIK